MCDYKNKTKQTKKPKTSTWFPQILTMLHRQPQLLRLQINDTSRLRELFVLWGGTWQTENLQLQWHSLAAQVIADISNMLSASVSVNEPVKLCTFTSQSVIVKCPSLNPQQSKYINSTAQWLCWCSLAFFFNKIKTWHNYNNAFLQLYIIVWYKFTEFLKSTKGWHAKCLKTGLYLVNTTEIWFQFLLKSVFFLNFFSFF